MNLPQFKTLSKVNFRRDRLVSLKYRKTFKQVRGAGTHCMGSLTALIQTH